MRNKQTAKIQHYVPQFLLRLFTCGDKPQIYVYDKVTGNSYKTNIKNAAAKNRFYDIKYKSFSYSYEPFLSEIEADTSNIVKRIMNSRSVSQLSIDDRHVVSHFVALQMVRTEQQRRIFQEIPDTIRRSFEKHGDDYSGFEKLFAHDDDDVKRYGCKSLLMSYGYAPFISDKDWILFVANASDSYYISDSPVAMQNVLDPSGYVGLSAHGIAIYLPLSKTITLGILCPSIKKSLKRMHDKESLDINLREDASSNHSAGYKGRRKLLTSLENDVPYMCDSGTCQRK